MATAPASNRRKTPRVRRRLKVVFDHAPQIRAFTTNISRTGMCVASDLSGEPGSRLAGSLVLPGGATAPFEAAVIWYRKARGTADLADSSSMGLEFVRAPGAEFEQLLGQALASPPARPAASDDAVPLEPAWASAFAAATATAPAAPARAPARAAADWLANAAGSTASLRARVQSAPLSATTATDWMAQACARIVDRLAPRGVAMIPVDLQVRVYPEVPVAPGSEVKITATVVEAKPDDRTIRFRIAVTTDDDVVAGGLMLHLVAR